MTLRNPHPALPTLFPSDRSQVPRVDLDGVALHRDDPLPDRSVRHEGVHGDHHVAPLERLAEKGGGGVIGQAGVVDPVTGGRECREHGFAGAFLDEADSVGDQMEEACTLRTGVSQLTWR